MRQREARQALKLRVALNVRLHKNSNVSRVCLSSTSGQYRQRELGSGNGSTLGNATHLLVVLFLLQKAQTSTRLRLRPLTVRFRLRLGRILERRHPTKSTLAADKGVQL